MSWQVASVAGFAPLTAQPAVAGDVVYTAWDNGTIVAHGLSGDRLWSGSAGSEPATVGPVVSGRRVYVVTADGGLTAFGL